MVLFLLPLSYSLSLVSSSEPPSLTSLESLSLQVTIEVVEDPQAKVEKDVLVKPSNVWPFGWLSTAMETSKSLLQDYFRGEEAGSSLKDRAPKEEEEAEEEEAEEEETEEEEEDYLIDYEYSEIEEQEDNAEEDDNKEQGWLYPFRDFYGEHIHLGIPGCCPSGPEWRWG